jgi:mannosylglycerate hydrolase
VQSGGRGLLIANRGLPEFEVVPDGRGTVALTLLRAVGWLSREDLLSRIGGAGPTVPVPGAQCPGYGRASYAIVPFSGGWLESGAARAAEDYLVPLYGSATGVHAGDLEPSHGALELEGDPGLAFSACKKSERGDALIVRVWNMAGVPSEGRVSPAFRPVAVRRVDLAEEVTADGGIEIAPDGSFLVTVAAYEIVTLAVFPFEQAEGAVEV